MPFDRRDINIVVNDYWPAQMITHIFIHYIHVQYTIDHPGFAENIAPDGGPGSDITVVRLQPLDNSWLQDGSRICKTKHVRWGHWVSARS